MNPGDGKLAYRTIRRLQDMHHRYFPHADSWFFHYMIVSTPDSPEVELWRMSSSFEFFIKESLLSIGRFDPVTGTLSSLDHQTGRQTTLQFRSSPILSLWDHGLTPLAQDAFLLEDCNKLKEVRVSSRVEPNGIYIDSMVQPDVLLDLKQKEANIEPPFYPGEEDLDALLKETAKLAKKKSKQKYFFFPVTVVRYLQQLRAASHGGFGIIAIEAGPSSKGCVESLESPVPCVSTVPLHLKCGVQALDALFKKSWDGKAFTPPKRHQFTRTRLLTCDTHSSEHTSFAYSEFVQRFSMDDLRALVEPVLSRPLHAPCLRLSKRKAFAAAPLMTLLYLSSNDPDLLLDMRHVLARRQWYREGSELQLDVERLLRNARGDFLPESAEGPQFLIELGRISASIGQWDIALGYLKDALRLFGTSGAASVAIFYMLGECYLAVKKPERALMCYKRVVKAIPNHPEAQRNMRRLASFAKATADMPGRGVSTRGEFLEDPDEDISLLIGLDNEEHFQPAGF